MGFVANFIHFPAVQNIWKSVKTWQSYTEFKGGNFFETQCTFYFSLLYHTIYIHSCHNLTLATKHQLIHTAASLTNIMYYQYHV